jgi:hypothetical protein
LWLLLKWLKVEQKILKLIQTEEKKNVLWKTTYKLPVTVFTGFHYVFLMNLFLCLESVVVLNIPYWGAGVQPWTLGSGHKEFACSQERDEGHKILSVRISVEDPDS